MLDFICGGREGDWSPCARVLPGEGAGPVPPSGPLPGPAVRGGQPSQGGPGPQGLCQGPSEEQRVGEGLGKVARAPGGRRQALRLDAHCGGWRRGAAGGRALLAQAAASTAGREREEGSLEFIEEGKEAREVARRGPSMGRRTLGKKGVAIPLGTSKSAAHQPRSERSTRDRHQGSAVPRGFGGPDWAPPQTQIWRRNGGTYLDWAGVAGGPSPLEDCQGVRVGGCSKPGGGGGSPKLYSGGQEG